MPAEGDSQTLYGYETHRGVPPATDKPIRLLSMEYCPFAERARIILAKHGLDHDIVNIDLGNKPAFLFEYSPNGQVPALIHEGHSIFESEIVVEYVEQRFPEKASLYPKDPAARAEARQLSANHGSKIIPSFYKVLFASKSGNPEDLKEPIEAWHKTLKTWVEDKLGDGPFFGGASENVTDILIWPWLYRADVFARNKTPHLLTEEQFPKTIRYIKAMRELPYIQATAATDENFLAFATSFAKGQKPLGYNIGSKHPIYAGPAEVAA